MQQEQASVRPPVATAQRQPRGIRLRHAIWGLVLVLVCFNAVLLALQAHVYLHNRTRDSILWTFRVFFLFSQDNEFLLAYSTVIGGVYAALSGAYVAVGLSNVWPSLQSRRAKTAAATSVTVKPVTAPASCDPVKTKSSAVMATLWRWQKLVSVRGQYFEVRLVVDETVEVIMQTVAAYTSSMSISNLSLNLSYAVVIWINCLAPLLVSRVYKRERVRQRVVWLLCDFALDFVWGTVIPAWMCSTMYATYADETVLVSFNSSREVQRVLILSWTSLLLSVFPFCNSLFGLWELLSLLKTRTAWPRELRLPSSPSLDAERLYSACTTS